MCSDRNEIPIIRNVVFGGVKCEAGTSSDCEACKITAKAMMVTFLLMNDSDAEDIGVEDWESDVFEKKIDDFNDDDHLLTISYLSERSIPDEL